VRGRRLTVQKLDIVGVRVELPSKQPLVLLKEVGGERYLPIWIGAVEATAIALAHEGVATPRPMTHDLMRDILVALRVEVARVLITELKDGVFYANLVFANGAEVSARPSDAIALAMRMGVPVYGDEEVLAEASISVPDQPEEQQENELERFREFLDQVSPEDFNTGP
jgi:bifunctional DNase/RNase